MLLRVPPDFVWLRSGRRTALVHETAEGSLGPLLLTSPHGSAEEGVRLVGGRGGAYRVALDNGDVVVFRFYRRGGFVARLVRDTYWGWPARPFKELVATVEARRRGVPVPEALGARIDRLWSGRYRGALVTRHLPGTESLWERLGRTKDAERRRQMSREAGNAVRALCEGGIYHPELNLNNCVVREDEGRFTAFVVDLDRAWVMRTALGEDLRRRTLRRLSRSARKLDPESRVFGAEELCALYEACASTGSR